MLNLTLFELLLRLLLLVLFHFVPFPLFSFSAFVCIISASVAGRGGGSGVISTKYFPIVVALKIVIFLIITYFYRLPVHFPVGLNV